MPNVLILEDNFQLAQDYKSALKEGGHEVYLANTSTEAVEVCRNVRIDLAIVDIFIVSGDTYIPDGGLTFIPLVRNSQIVQSFTKSSIPIIALSGGALISSQNSPLETAIMFGATQALSKPIERDDLLFSVNELLRH